MRKVKVNSDLVTRPVDDSPEVDWSDLSAGCDPSGFDNDPVDRSERMHLDDLLPFLEERIAFKMPSDLRHLDGVLDYLNERMLRLGIVTPGDSEVLIALDEAIVNAIKHGNKCDSRKAVHIVAEFSMEGVRFTVADEGSGFELEKVPDPTEPCRLLEPSGRGLLLINHIMDEVCFNQSGNRLEMFKRASNSPKSQSHSSNGHNTPE
ncbi:MAG: ATP-binding protein [Acidobacteriota bacterium]